MYNRKVTKEIVIGKGNKILKMGGDNPIVIQSMANTDTKNVIETIKQILELESAGCELIRVAVPDMQSAESIPKIIKEINIPLVADIHFDYKLAIKSVENGVDKLRLNPGNIGSYENVREVVKAVSERNIPIRIGVNGGSLSKEILRLHNGVTPQAMVESAMEHINILEDLNYNNIVVSIKSSDVQKTIEAYEILSKKVDYPLHIGITEAGGRLNGIIKSSVGLGAILTRGIGDTIRVSLTDNPVEEIKCGRLILQSLGVRYFSIEFISCPTCGRTKVDLINISREIEDRLSHIEISRNIKVAVMGCVVNGPGEASSADIGIASGDGQGILFKKGEIICKIPENEIIDRLVLEVEKICSD